MYNYIAMMCSIAIDGFTNVVDIMLSLFSLKLISNKLAENISKENNVSNIAIKDSCILEFSLKTVHCT